MNQSAAFWRTGRAGNQAGPYPTGANRRRIRQVLGALWLVDAALQAQPQLFSVEWWRDELPQSVMGQPSPVATSILWATGHLVAHAATVNGLVVAAEALLGSALMFGRYPRAAIAASIPLALGVWWIGEGFGALPTGFGQLAAGAPGPVLYYPLVGMLAWPRPGTDRQAREGPVNPYRAAAVWAAIWVGGAVLELPWRFPPAQVLQANIDQSADGQPTWMAAIAHWAYHCVGSHPLLVPATLAVLQMAIGLGVQVRRGRRNAAFAGILFSLGFWIIVQDLGAIPGGGATDVGAGPLVILVGLAVAGHPNGASASKYEHGLRYRRVQAAHRPAAMGRSSLRHLQRPAARRRRPAVRPLHA